MKKILILGIVILLLVGGINTSLVNAGESHVEDEGLNDLSDEYEEIDPIKVNGDDDFDEQNWTGEGEEDDPYRLNENYSIDGEEKGYCIWIQKTSKHFVINNTRLYNASGGDHGAGVVLRDIDNGEIVNNTIEDNEKGMYIAGSVLGANGNYIKENKIKNNTGAGIMLDDSTDNMIYNNTIENNNQTGVSLEGSDENTISNNSITENEGAGSSLDNSAYNHFANNILSNNNGTGISLFDSAKNDITNNAIEDNNKTGVSLEYYLFSNTISNNSISYNEEIGINISNTADNNIIRSNNISYNKEGINITDSSDNEIYLNKFIENELQAYDSAKNHWDASDPFNDGEGGNYWADYDGEDGGHGIGEDPYHIEGGDNQDDYPWMNPEMVLFYDLTVEIEGKGEVEIEPDEDKYEEETKITLTAIPDDYWHFDEWSGDVSGDDNEISITMDENKVITAHFKEDEYSLTVNIEGNGTIVDEEKFEFEDGETKDYIRNTEVTLTADPDEHWYFVNWTGDHEGSEEEINLTMDEDKEITAVFEEHRYELNVTIEGKGEVGIEPDNEVYEPGATVNLTADPDEHWYFVNWTDDHEGFEEEINITMDEDKEITAVFEEHRYELNVTVEGDGSVKINPDQPNYEPGSKVTLTADPDEHWYFAGWTGYEESEDDEINITMNSNIEITAQFEKGKSNFEVDIISSFDDEVKEDEEIKVEYTVGNTGELDGEQQITFAVYDEEDEKIYENDTQLILEAGELSEKKQFVWAADEAGNYTLEVSSEDHEADVEVTVKEGDKPEFEVTNLEIDPEEPEPGEEFDISVEVTNIGETDGEYAVEFEINGEIIDSKTVELDPDQTETVIFTHSIDDTGEHELEVEGQTISTTVEEKDENKGSLPMVFGFIGIFVLTSIVVLIVILPKIRNKNEDQNDHFQNREGVNSEIDEREEESENYDLSEEEKDEIDLYG
ncbi:MAG: InlB B-repeat-containing protein [Candidatus Natronoplasma sp.]